MTFQAYDVLQISRDNATSWQDFSTLRSENDFANAEHLVATGMWDSVVVLFRVVRWTPTAMDSHGVTVLAETTPVNVVDNGPDTSEWTDAQRDALTPNAARREFMDKFSLETMIDASSLSHVLSLIADICHEKASHVEENWQDKHLAHDWTCAARRVEALSVVSPITNVSMGGR